MAKLKDLGKLRGDAKRRSSRRICVAFRQAIWGILQDPDRQRRLHSRTASSMTVCAMEMMSSRKFSQITPLPYDAIIFLGFVILSRLYLSSVRLHYLTTALFRICQVLHTHLRPSMALNSIATIVEEDDHYSFYFLSKLYLNTWMCLYDELAVVRQ